MRHSTLHTKDANSIEIFKVRLTCTQIGDSSAKRLESFHEAHESAEPPTQSGEPVWSSIE